MLQSGAMCEDLLEDDRKAIVLIPGLKYVACHKFKRKKRKIEFFQLRHCAMIYNGDMDGSCQAITFRFS